MELLRVEGLSKCYGEKNVVNEISFGINQGDIVGFLGPNGAGKSTTIRMITGIEKLDSGRIYRKDKLYENITVDLKRHIGLVPQDIAIYNDLSAYDNVRFFCSLYGFSGKELDHRVKEALEFVALWDKRKERPAKFSGGMKRRLNIACAIAHSPELLIMDEPTVGIDPQSRNYILDTIRIMNQRGTTVVYVSHYMEEIESICNRVIVMDHGNVIEDMKKDELKAQYQSQGIATLEDIFLFLTGTKLRDEEENG